MKVDRNATIAGFRLLKVRDFLKRYADGLTHRSIAHFFKVDELEAGKIAKSMADAGYITFNEARKAFFLTDLGVSLSNANFAKRISRAKADELVQAFLQRVHDINDREELTHRVTAVRAFGSYITDATDLGDIDLAVALEPRRSSHVEESIERAEKSGKSIRTYIEMLLYGATEVRQLLKARQPYISIHSYDEPETLSLPSAELYSLASEQVECPLA